MNGVWKNWHELSGDDYWEQYGGRWGRQDPNNPRVWYVIEHTDMVDACGTDAEGYDQYVDTVYRIDLDDVSDTNLQSALDCCGLDFADWSSEPTAHEKEQAYVECLQSYGLAAPMGEYTSNSYPLRARAEARRAVEDMISDSDLTANLLDHPVNKLGSTAREYARGDMDSAMERGVLAGNESARIMARMYGIDQNVIDDVRPLDWMPYFVGYLEAIGGSERETRDGAASEYTLGYERGLQVLNGKAPAPSWIK